MIDDSALFHASRYDPVKAREYYLRTRKLKGRAKGTSAVKTVEKSKPPAPTSQGARGKPNRSNTASRRAELKAQKEALEKRLDYLREVLQELVEAAKKRSGGDPNKKKEEGKAPETQADKADRNKAEKKSKPETASEKKERAKKAKEAYEKENPTSLSQDVEILREQVADIQAKVQKAIDDARARQQQKAKAGTRAEIVRPKNKPEPKLGRTGRPLSFN